MAAGAKYLAFALGRVGHQSQVNSMTSLEQVRSHDVTSGADSGGTIWGKYKARWNWARSASFSGKHTRRRDLEQGA